MPEDNEDLWPDLKLGTVTTPVSILRSQAALLSKKTQGIIEGTVETQAAEHGITHVFVLIVPSFGDYRFQLLKIRHQATFFYPVFVDEMPRGTALTPQVASLSVRGLADEEAFRSWLRETLASAATMKIIENLYAQASAK